ncbi:MAG: FAD:protein FMN transferase [Turicibacter sp.]|nr:FAD:protein FMN transferase [Turicibacter sp.]
MKKAILIFALFVLGACSAPSQSQTRFERQELLMGTAVRVRIDVEPSSGIDAESILDEAFQKIEGLEQLLTVNDEEAPSEILEINRQAGIEPVQVSETAFSLIEEAVRYTQMSNGTFNVAIGPLVKLWNINFEGARRPDDEEIIEALPLLDFNKVILNTGDRTVFLEEPGMRLDLGGIAKGFVADYIASFLQDEGIESALLDMGGDLFLLGSTRQGNPWKVGIQNPHARRNPGASNLVGRIPVINQGVVTSGVYERYVEVDGVHYHHILDSTTGFPFSTGLVSVTVISDRAVDGEGYTTILFGKGLDGGLEFVESLDNVEAIFITDTDEVVVSSGLVGQFTLTSDEFTLRE